MGEGWKIPLEQLAAQAVAQLATVRQAQEQVRELRVSAAAADGLVAVEVGAQGQLLALRLDAAVYDRMPEGQLAEVITELTLEAAAGAAMRVREIVAPVLPAGCLPAGRDWPSEAAGVVSGVSGW
jgi:DNA-binding protein YbaB